ncbi:ABC transporter ATP-binding protein [Botrimarina hoheduenensis]|uniref:Putative ABC transporter ATP-binding protein n=1 Tax=Botrimarina hoheduenensis TaxID=2528000 RepID=A0A5C5W7Y9_9BACT|nr:ABC transporter ATP-binding protein [Botrimarina hoheduenensis]TWT46830.1 putative ABC transporter ATP-binding protein [Botrimarina hoheduenensis]
MNQFRRALRLAFRRPGTVAACWATSIIVAVLWATNLVAVWPVVDAVMHGESIPSWLALEVEHEETVVAELEIQRQKLLAEQAAAEGDDASSLAYTIADLEHRQQNSQAKIDRVRWVQPYATRWLPDTPFETLLYVCVFVLVGTLAKNLFRIINLLLVARLGELVSFELRKQYFKQVLRLDLAEFSDRGRGELMTRCTSDMSHVSSGVQVLFGQAIREPLKMLACFVLAAWFSWRLLALTITIAPLAVIGIRWLGKSLKRANRRAMEELSGVYESLTETLGGIRIIRAFGRESAERARFNHSLQQLYWRRLKIAFYDSLASPLTENLGVAMVVTAALAGGYLVLNQQTHLFGIALSDTPLTHGQMTAFFAMLAGMGDPARRLSGVFGAYHAATASAERVYAVLDRQPEIQDPSTPKALPTPWKSLRFDNVSFQYGPDRLVLEEVSLEVRAGETLALVGPNGCGKSTLLSLPIRFYDPCEGTVSIDGVDLRDLRLRDLRSRIGVVSQQAQLMNLSIAENIASGRPGASFEEVVAAAKKAHADRFINERLTDGYETIVGPGGCRLSGGQRQRIALARAILRNPELLILDEATSQIDIESEQLIHQTLTTFLRGRTTLLITHRPSTLTLADRVAVMDAGRLIDVGTTDELAERCDLFRRLCCQPMRESA